MDQEDQKLDQLLNCWKVQADPIPGLSAKVWRRLAEEEDLSIVGRISGWFSSLSLGLPLRPVHAGAVVALTIMAGIAAAEWKLSRQATAAVSWERVYLTSINPAVPFETGLHQHGSSR